MSEQNNKTGIKVNYTCGCFWFWDDTEHHWYPNWCQNHEADVITEFDQLTKRRERS